MVGGEAGERVTTGRGSMRTLKAWSAILRGLDLSCWQWMLLNHYKWESNIRFFFQKYYSLKITFTEKKISDFLFYRAEL